MEKKVLNVTHHSAVHEVNKKNKGQFFDLPSLTVEGQAEPMSTIIDRFQRGQAVNGHTPYYDSEVNQNFENEVPFKESEYDLSDIDIARAKQQAAIELIEADKRSRAEAQKLLDDERLADEVLARRQVKKQELEKIPEKGAEE